MGVSWHNEDLPIGFDFDTELFFSTMRSHGYSYVERDK